MSKAYLMGMLEVDNPDGMGPYLEKVEETVTNHGGRYLVRMGEIHYSEDDPNSIAVIFEFPDAEAAMAWKNSPEYQEILPHRLDNSHGPVLIVDGL